ncbi:MAG: hypothetical protein PWP70_1377 [Moorella sp. (in: firmicutes)]|nr:hypothetical protein [Moorella sp. (in: firmicutes)]
MVQKMKKWKLVLFIAGWLVLGLLVTAVNSLGGGEHGGHEPAATTAAAETAH